MATYAIHPILYHCGCAINQEQGVCLSATDISYQKGCGDAHFLLAVGQRVVDGVHADPIRPELLGTDHLTDHQVLIELEQQGVLLEHSMKRRGREHTEQG